VEFVSNVYGEDNCKVIQCNIRNITKRKNIEKSLLESEKRFKNMSYHDSMTGLYNRTYFCGKHDAFGQRCFSSAPLSIMSIDIDGLKLTNDMFGHQSGDALLISAAKIYIQHLLDKST